MGMTKSDVTWKKNSERKIERAEDGAKKEHGIEG